MPSAVGFVNITSIESSSIVQFGDVVQMLSTDTSKSFAGSGSFLTGNLANTNNAVSTTNTVDPDLVDSSLNKISSGVNVF